MILQLDCQPWPCPRVGRWGLRKEPSWDRATLWGTVKEGRWTSPHQRDPSAPGACWSSHPLPTPTHRALKCFSGFPRRERHGLREALEQRPASSANKLDVVFGRRGEQALLLGLSERRQPP